MKRHSHQLNTIHIRLPVSADFLLSPWRLPIRVPEDLGMGIERPEGWCSLLRNFFSFYERQAARGSTVEIDMEDQGYRLALSLSFSLADPDMQAFNLTWNVNHDSEESMEMLGPMIAARTLSSLRMEFDADENVILRLTRNREYAMAERVALPPSGLTSTHRPVNPSRDDLFHFASMVPHQDLPFCPFFLPDLKWLLTCLRPATSMHCWL